MTISIKQQELLFAPDIISNLINIFKHRVLDIKDRREPYPYKWYCSAVVNANEISQNHVGADNGIKLRICTLWK